MDILLFENNILRRIFGLKRDEVIGGQRKLHYELHSLRSSPRIIRMMSRRMRWARHVVCMGEKGNAYRIFMRNAEGNRPLGRHRRRWEYNINMYLR
jgi:hypothetical protein